MGNENRDYKEVNRDCKEVNRDYKEVNRDYKGGKKWLDEKGDIVPGRYGHGSLYILYKQ